MELICIWKVGLRLARLDSCVFTQEGRKMVQRCRHRPSVGKNSRGVVLSANFRRTIRPWGDRDTERQEDGRPDYVCLLRRAASSSSRCSTFIEGYLRQTERSNSRSEGRR